MIFTREIITLTIYNCKYIISIGLIEKEADEMIKFVTVDKVYPGVTLARDIYGIDTFTNRVVMLKAGQELTVGHITKLMSLDLQGVYIDEKIEAPEILPSEERKKMEEIIDTLYKFIDKPASGLYTEKVSFTSSLFTSAIDQICSMGDLHLNVKSLNFYDDAEYNHTLSVVVLALALGAELGVPKNGLMDLALAALLHDIGDTKIDPAILSKPGPLIEAEYETVKTHTTLGYEIVSDITEVSDFVKTAILHHHERFDGTGYPEKLSGKDIPLFARIIAVADVYSALTSKRPYREAYSVAEAIEYIMGNADRQFDGDVVTAFLSVISPYPVGSCVKLSSGEKAVVADQNSSNPLRPKVFLMDNPTVMIDLYRDQKYFNIVIEDLIND